MKAKKIWWNTWRSRCLSSLLYIVLMPVWAHAQEVSLEGPPAGEMPLPVSVEFRVVSITDVNEQDETIDIEGFLSLRWRDSRLAYELSDVGLSDDAPMPDGYSRTPRRTYVGVFEVVELFRGWRPYVWIPNGIGDRVKTNVVIAIWPDGMTEYGETFSTTVETPMDLRKYPFDEQDLQIYLHPLLYQRDELVLIPDVQRTNTWSRGQGIADWSRGSVMLEERANTTVHGRDSASTISEVVVHVQIARRPLDVLFSLILPLLILVALTWSVFWLDREALADRINISFIGILSIVAYYFVILEQVPEISYLTLIDAFILATFLNLAATVVVSFAVERCNRTGREALGNKLDQTCRWAFPTGYAVTILIMALIFLNL